MRADLQQRPEAAFVLRWVGGKSDRLNLSSNFGAAFARAGVKVYEGTVRLITQVATGTLKKGEAILATVTAQACNEKVCLPPATLPLEITP